MAKAKLMTIGCDLGDRESHICELDHEGKVLKRDRIRTTRPGFLRAFEKRARCRVVIEIGTHARWVSELLKALGHDVIVADPRHLALIFKGRKKTDKNDAEALARLARSDLNLLNHVRLRPTAKHVDLAVVHARHTLVISRGRLINHVRGVLKALELRLPDCEVETFHKHAKPVVTDALEPAIGALLAAIEGMTALIKGYDQQIELLCEKYSDTKVLRQVTGVGPILSLTFVLTINEAQRFRKSRDVPAYLGLCPKKKQSGEQDPELRISKAGNPYLRQLLVQSSQYILGPFGPDTELRRWGAALANRGGKSVKKRAIVAVARKLSVLLHRLWVTGEEYEPLGYGQKAA